MIWVRRADTLSNIAAEEVEITGQILEVYDTQDCWAITIWGKGGVEDDCFWNHRQWVDGTTRLKNTAEEGLCKIVLSSVWGLLMFENPRDFQREILVGSSVYGCGSQERELSWSCKFDYLKH